MSTKPTAEGNSSATFDERTRSLAFIAGTFGVDATGAKHRYSRPRDTVYVTRDGELEEIESLDGRDIDDWISYIRFKRGWVDQWFHETMTPVEGAARMQRAVNAAAEDE